MGNRSIFFIIKPQEIQMSGSECDIERVTTWATKIYPVTRCWAPNRFVSSEACWVVLEVPSTVDSSSALTVLTITARKKENYKEKSTSF